MTIGALAADAWKLTERAAGEGDAGGRVILGITGPPGAGKSTLARALVAELGERAAYLPLDGFHLSDPLLVRLGLLDRKGSEPTFDVRGYGALLRRVLREVGQDVYVPDYDREVDAPISARHVVPPSARLVITEGNYLACDRPGWRAARELMAECWYVEAPAMVRRKRLVERQLAGGKGEREAREWVGRNDLPNGEFVATSRDRCERIVSTIGMDMFK